MKKTIRLMPTSIYDAPALERWLTAQSEKGLFLSSANWIFASFLKETPRKKVYRLEVITGGDALLPKEQLETYKEFGWEYVTAMSGLFHVFANEEENPAELHTDPVVQSLAYEKIEKKVNRGLSSCIILLIYMLFINGVTLRSGGFTLTDFIEQNLLLFFLADALFLLLFFFGRLLPCLQISKQMKALRNGSFPKSQNRNIRFHSGYCHLGVFLCLCVMVYYTLSIPVYTSAEETRLQQGNVPFVTLEEIEGLPPLYPIDYSDPTTFPKQEDYLYFEDHSLLAPKQFILRQDEATPVRNSDSPAYLWMMYVEVAPNFLAEPYHQAQIKETLPADAIPLDIQTPDGIDALQAYRTSEGTYFFLKKDNISFSVHHKGNGDPLPYLTRFADFAKNKEGWPFLPDSV